MSPVPREASETAAYTLSPSEAAEILGVHPRTLKRWVSNGKVKALRTPGKWLRFRREDLDQFLRENAA